jgi:hypothetical protein
MQEQDLPWQRPRQLWTQRDSTGQIVALGHATFAAATKWADEHGTTFAPWQEGEYLTASR